MFTVDLVTNTSGIPIVSGITPSANNTGYIMIFVLMTLSLVISQ